MKINTTAAVLQKAFKHFKISADVNEFVSYLKTNSFTKTVEDSEIMMFQQLLR